MRQLLKFCLVGASSTVIDKSLQRALLIAFPLLPWWIAQTISFVFGVTNGFIWNRRWTFRDRMHGASGQQYSKFVITNIVGLILNLLITKIFLVVMTKQVTHSANPHPNTVLIASLCAVPIVVIWNFSAARFWTFRAPKTPPPTPASPPPPIANPHA